MKASGIITFFLCILTSIAGSQTLKGVQRATSSNFFEYESFGYGMNYSGNTAIIGTFDIRWIGDPLWVGRKPIKGGRVYILERNKEGIWIEKQVLQSPDKKDFDRFGEMGLAISENYAIVSATYDEQGLEGDKPIKAAGAAYVYIKNDNGKWEFLQKLVAFDRKAKTKFGMSVSISEDYLFIGSSHNHTDSNNKNFVRGAGAVYVFKKDKSGKWNHLQKLVASDRSEKARFGFASSVSGDYLCVGAFAEDAKINNSIIQKSGAAYIFKKDENGLWKETQKLTQEKRSGLSSYGSAISLKSEQLIIGASSEHSWSEQGDSLRQTGAAYVYNLDRNGSWKLTQKLTPSNPDEYDNFGVSVGISEKRVLVGIPYDEVIYQGEKIPNAGSAQFYEKNKNEVWEKTQKLISHDPAPGERFSHYAMLSDDFAAISEHLDGARPVNTVAKNKTGLVFFYNYFPSKGSEDYPTYELVDYVQPINPDTTLIVDVPVVNDTPIETPTDSVVVIPIEQGDPPIFLLNPNPSTGPLKIVILNHENISYEITIKIPFGSEVYYKKTSSSRTEIDLSRVDNGTYFVTVSSKFGETKQPLVINKGGKLDPRNDNNNGGGRK
jgi:hypothetical protein